MDAHRYLREIVEPTVTEFENEPTSVRRAFLACIVTYHAIEYLGFHSQREAFWKECPGFALVDRVAHAAKHVEGRHQPLRSDDVISRPPGIWGVAVFDLSRFDDPVGGVTIQGKTSLDILHALKGAVTFLRSKITEWFARWGDKIKRTADNASIDHKFEDWPPKQWTPPRCHCGELATFEVTLRMRVDFYCAKHLPENALQPHARKR